MKIPYKIGSGEADYAKKIKRAFRSVHIFITSDECEDTEFIRERFFEWRRKQSQSKEGI